MIDVKELKKQIKVREDKLNREKGKRDAEREALKEMSFSSIKEAEDYLTSSEKDLEKLRKEYKKLYNKIIEENPWIKE